jgi:hypothetical protein
MNLQDEVLDLSHLLEHDLSWWEGIYLPGLAILPEPYRGEITEKMYEFLEPMERPYKLEKVNHFNED